MNYTAKVDLAIFLMAISIYLLRLMGYWLAGFIRFSPALKTWLDYLPGCILMAIIAPSLLSSSPIQWIASGLIAVIMAKTHNLFISMLIGCLLIMLWRIYAL
jgi:uncharacterized membrane protein